MNSNFRCIVCDCPLTPGITDWHYVCSRCNYESAFLESEINENHSHENINETEREIGLRALRQDNFSKILRLLDKLGVKSDIRLLDVGSAHGWFLELAKERYAIWGIEPDAVVCADSINRNLPVRSGYFPDALLAGESFDIICFNDVIEHIPDIQGALQACHDRLSERGILVLNLPSSEGFFYRTAKLMAGFGITGYFFRMWQKDLPSPHVHYFNASNLTALTHKFGFRLVLLESLPTVSSQGLFERLKYTKQSPSILVWLEYIFLRLCMPVITRLRSDIMVLIFERC